MTCICKKCDICGKAQCRMEGERLQEFQFLGHTSHYDLLACKACIRVAIKFAYEASCTFATNYEEKPCGIPEPVQP